MALVWFLRGEPNRTARPAGAERRARTAPIVLRRAGGSAAAISEGDGKLRAARRTARSGREEGGELGKIGRKYERPARRAQRRLSTQVRRSTAQPRLPKADNHVLWGDRSFSLLHTFNCPKAASGAAVTFQDHLSWPFYRWPNPSLKRLRRATPLLPGLSQPPGPPELAHARRLRSNPKL